MEARALAVGLPKDAPEADIIAAEAKKAAEKSTLSSSEKEEDTKKIFNLSETPLTGIKSTEPIKKVITDPVKAWGQKNRKA